MFLLPTFPLIDQIGAHVIIWKLISLRLRYSSCLLPSNGLICISKTSKFCIQIFEKRKLWTPKFAIFGPPWCVIIVETKQHVMQIELLQIFATSMDLSQLPYMQSSHSCLPLLLDFFVQVIVFSKSLWDLVIYFLHHIFNPNIINGILASFKHYIPKICVTKRWIFLQLYTRYNTC
jgi:hypothetical protein